MARYTEITPANLRAAKVVSEKQPGADYGTLLQMLEFEKLMNLLTGENVPSIGDEGFIEHMASIGKDVRAKCRAFGIPLSVVDPSVSDEGEALTPTQRVARA